VRWQTEKAVLEDSNRSFTRRLAVAESAVAAGLRKVERLDAEMSALQTESAEAKAEAEAAEAEAGLFKAQRRLLLSEFLLEAEFNKVTAHAEALEQRHQRTAEEAGVLRQEVAGLKLQLQTDAQAAEQLHEKTGGGSPAVARGGGAPEMQLQTGSQVRLIRQFPSFCHCGRRISRELSLLPAHPSQTPGAPWTLRLHVPSMRLVPPCRASLCSPWQGVESGGAGSPGSWRARSRAAAAAAGRGRK